ncbi:uncharacterized protein [Drosophila bipectinata]|uniref:uncharacterized protein n=1 Tax=Drosophila bipectinata TaxID=42026 RepID=UPI0038B31EA9
MATAVLPQMPGAASALYWSGRVSSSELLQYDGRHPIILSNDCHLSLFLVHFTHRIALHGGNQLMIRQIRAKFWIQRVRNLDKSVVYSCKVCVIHKKKLQTQLMGDLSKERTSFSRPFTYNGSLKRAVTGAYSHQQLVWHFIPPGAPHMGSLWEAGVKSFKTLFYKSTATRKYTFKKLASLLAKIEASLNSRPLAPMSESPR